MSDLTPTYIYKIIHASTPPPSPLPEALPVSDLDKSDQFIHLSTAVQVPGTLGRFFNDQERVYICRIKYANVESKIKWEDGKSKGPGGVGEPDIFPHLYNDLRLGSAEIDSVEEWTSEAGNWDTAVAKSKESGWFVY
ncbi:hypothetical protein D9619_000749 [Psilocybe cf. subviscida]|uniref:DUF952 domain-containing protein n=1 Tax=Psilocybe cf. subviscida TaxID=2480587 RepID=A0A8H5BDE5_9AGAR|nr:hypothetical protein D9619_000749 [Psilocybe cf. subviscida]